MGGAFDVLEIQLVLLRRMADLQAPLVDRALKDLGVGHTELRAANHRWNAAAFGRPGAVRWARFRGLGAPAVDRAPLPRAGLVRSCWPLPLWPEYWLQVLSDRADVVQHLSLTRADGEPRPRLVRPSVVTPWSCTLAECAASFPDVVFNDPGPTGHESLTCADPDTGERFGVRAIWGLVQRVEPVGCSMYQNASLRVRLQAKATRPYDLQEGRPHVRGSAGRRAGAGRQRR